MEHEGQGYKTAELIDACMNALREDERVSQGLRQSETDHTDDLVSPSFSLAMGDFEISDARPFYQSCERGTAERNSTDCPGYSTTPRTPQNMVITDSSGDEAFTSDILSPIGGSNFGVGEGNTSSGWAGQHDDFSSNFVREGAELFLDQASCSTSAHPPAARCNKEERRFLSTETIGSVSQCRYKERADFNAYGSTNSSNFAIERNIIRERSYDESTSASASKAYNATSRDNRSRSSDEIERIYNQSSPSSSSVLRDIDIAVSFAQSRFKTTYPRSDIISSTSQCSSYLSKTENVPFDRSHLHEQVGSCSVANRDVSHTSNACLIDNEWKRKLDCHTTVAPIQKQSRNNYGLTHNGNYGRSAGSYHSAESNNTYSASGIESDQKLSVSELVRSESAEQISKHRPVFQTKIDSDHDERKTTSYTPDTPETLSLTVQSPAHWASCRQLKGQIEVRSSRKEVYSQDAVSDNKPVNLCLQQEKNRSDNFLGKTQTISKINKAADIRKYKKSFTNRGRPYQYSKRRTRSQCSPNEVCPNSSQVFGPNYAGINTETSERRSGCDMGIDNISALENYKESSFVGGQGTTSDLNLGSLFTTAEGSHMMVQDDMKTYAVLSGRCNEDLSSSGTSQQQPQSIYHQARHSHSIINYVGHHGQSHEIRGQDMSPSPPVRDHRTPSSGILQQGKSYHNVIVGGRPHLHSMNPHQQDNQRGQGTFQRSFESQPNVFDIHESRQHHQHVSMPLAHHTGSSSFTPVHLSSHHQQPPQYLVKQQDRREYFDNMSSHSGMVTPGSMAHYSGSLQVSQSPHGGYLKPPPIDLDELSDDERERMRVKRERNRVAAAKCRNRRRELLERLEKEAEQLEREQELLRENVRRLRVQKLQLGNMLEEHEPTCHKKLDLGGDEKTTQDKEQSGTSDKEQTTSALSGRTDTSESPTKNTASPLHVTTQA